VKRSSPAVWKILPVRSSRLESHVQPVKSVKNRRKNGEFFEKQFLEKITPNMRYSSSPYMRLLSFYGQQQGQKRTFFKSCNCWISGFFSGRLIIWNGLVRADRFQHWYKEIIKRASKNHISYSLGIERSL
jgi:hypothetical protein